MMQRTVSKEAERILPVLGDNRTRLAAAIINYGLLAGITSGNESDFYNALAKSLLNAFQPAEMT